MNNEELRLKVATIDFPRGVKPAHHFYDCDDRRYFRCSHCRSEHSWRQFCDAGQKHPEGPCPGTEENYPESRDAIIAAVLKLPEEKQEAWARYILDDISHPTFSEAEHALTVATADPAKMCLAFIAIHESPTP